MLTNWLFLNTVYTRFIVAYLAPDYAAIFIEHLTCTVYSKGKDEKDTPDSVPGD